MASIPKRPSSLLHAKPFHAHGAVPDAAKRRPEGGTRRLHVRRKGVEKPRLRNRSLLIGGGAFGLLLAGLQWFGGLPGLRSAGDGAALALGAKAGDPAATSGASSDGAGSSGQSAVSKGRSPASVRGRTGALVQSADGTFESADGSLQVEAERPPPDFDAVAATLEANADMPVELAGQLETVFDQVNWRDLSQVGPMTAILAKVFKQHERSRDIIEPYVEREVFRQLLLSPDDPRPSRQLIDVYFSVVSDVALQKRFILRVRRQNEDSASLAYYDGIFAKITGRSVQPEDLEDEMVAVAPTAEENASSTP